MFQTHSNKPGNGFENSKGAYFNNGYSKHFREPWGHLIKEHVGKKNFYSNAFE